jgi:4-alpha-glucanotransferase
VRLDHVMGLKRLYLIPDGMPPDQRAYLRFPCEALLAVCAQESVRHQCILIGEDLGTVPEDFRTTLSDWGIWSYQVMLFERAADGAGKSVTANVNISSIGVRSGRRIFIEDVYPSVDGGRFAALGQAS